MKKYIFTKSILAGIMVFITVSCSDSFLQTESTEYLPAEKLDPSSLSSLMRGIYANMYQTGTGGTNLDHDDFGQKSYDIYSDLLSGDMVLAGYNYGWYQNIADYTASTDYTRKEDYKPWRYYYRIIFGCNSIIDALGGTDVDVDVEDVDARYIMGQAKTMRAYAYYYLANLYSNKYDPTAAILPVYTSKDQTAAPLSSTSEVYDLMISDLETAVEYLDGYTRVSKNEVNKSIAEGLLSYVYATTGDYAKTIEMTSDVIMNGEFSILPIEKVTTTGFNNVSDPSWMWGMDLTLDQGLDLVSWWGQVDIYTYSYAWAGDPKTMDSGLYSKIRSTDSRKNQFTDPWGEGLFYPGYKFYAPNRVIGGQREVTTDYVYMRIEEMYLLKAEAEAFSGNDNAAQSTLIELVSQRDTDPSYISSLTGDDLKNEIYLQWRIEMWGEGKSYLAMKRNKATITLEGHLENNNTPIRYDDDRLTLEIPSQEYQDNPNVNK